MRLRKRQNALQKKNSRGLLREEENDRWEAQNTMKNLRRYIKEAEEKKRLEQSQDQR